MSTGSDDTLVATSAAAASASRRSPSRSAVGAVVHPRGEVIGRYVIVSKLGAGAMGVVYAAYDPELDRRVALKLLHAHGNERSGTQPASGPSAQRHALREAQALARLAHPNVVGVHDVGVHDGQVFVAMEFVQGRTLTAWLSEAERSWPEIVDVFVAAGRGLAAAHAQGLVHRDFKPDNVMLAVDGRVRVMDFGLAQADAHLGHGRAVDRSDDGAPASAVATVAGELVGTPAYMAPEQFAGRSVSAATDQFAWSVALWEALYGQRPFTGGSLLELGAAVLEGRIVPPPPAVRVPPWLRKLMLRGLSIDAAQRWPSMEAAIEALSRGRARSRQRTWLLGAGAAVGVALAVLGTRELAERQRVIACRSEGEQIAAVWSPEREISLRAAWLGTGLNYAATSAETVAAALDRQASAWEHVRTQACLAREAATADPELDERANWCLDERRVELESLLARLESDDPRTVAYAVRAVADLVPPETCSDRDQLASSTVPPAQARDAVRAAQAELSRADALGRTGAYEDGLAASRAALELAETAGWPPLITIARLRSGKALREAGKYVEAEPVLVQTYFDAAERGETRVARRAADELGLVVGFHLERHDEGLRWLQHGKVQLAQAPDPTGLVRASLLGTEGVIRYAAGEYTAARAVQEEALALREAALGPDHIDVAATLGNLANVLRSNGDVTEARKLMERARTIRERTQGSAHPDMADTLTNLIATLPEDDPELLELSARAHEIRVQTLGPDHPRVAKSLGNLAVAYAIQGRSDEASEMLDRTVEILERVHGSDHSDVALALYNVAAMRVDMADWERARASAERALAIQERALGPDHPHVALTLELLGAIASHANDDTTALATYERALKIREAALEPTHPDVAGNLCALGTAHHLLGSDSDARRAYERAVAIAEPTPATHAEALSCALAGLAELELARGEPAEAQTFSERAVVAGGGASTPTLAAAQFALARAQWQRGADPVAALEGAREAGDNYRASGKRFEHLAAKVAAWISAHERGR